MFIEYEYYDWNNLISQESRFRMRDEIDEMVSKGHYWDNSPPYQTNINVFGIPTDDWNNLKMSFIWSCFAYLKREAQIKTIKSWGYVTSLDIVQDRNIYWHNHERPNATVLSGVYYLDIPPNVNMETSGTEFAPMGVENPDQYFFAPAKIGHWIIWPGKAWHRPGIPQSQQNRYIVAADMEL